MLLDDLAAALTDQRRLHQRVGQGESTQTTAGKALESEPAQQQPQPLSGAGCAVLISDGQPPISSGSRSLVRHLLFRCLLSASTRRVVVLSLLFPASHFHCVLQQVKESSSEAPSPALRGLEAAAQQKMAILDAFSHLRLDDLHSASPSASSTLLDAPLPCVQHTQMSTTLNLAVLEAAIRSLAASAAPSAVEEAEGVCVLFVDGLSSLLFHHPPSAVLSWLVSLRSIPSTSLVLHADSAVPDQLLSSPHALMALERLAHTSLAVTEVRQEKLLTAPSQFRYHFSVAATHRGGRSGRVRSTAEHWTLQPGAFLLSSASNDRSESTDSVDAVTLTLNSLRFSSPSSAASPSIPQSSFNLSTSDKQRQAKAQLQLPYQHTGGRHLAVHFGEGGLQLTAADSSGAPHQHQLDDDPLDDDEEEDDDDDLDI